ncbi:hypothetical protein BGO17_04485 [Candidatus Saccharibacteria bacterium 49-20]|nr:MAG: hypothetical protein BGO17_04485 [Candidatus Saccharibacteria bacterium 49-20]
MSHEQLHIHTNPQETLGSSRRGYEVRGDSTEPTLYFISGDKPGMRWDGVPIRIITDVAPHPESHPASRYLDEPLFENNKGEIRSLGNRLVNADDCNPSFLLTLADRVSNGDMPYPEEISAEAVEHIRSVFLDGATPRMFHDDLLEYTNIIFKDDDQPETYRITGKLFFESMTTRNILAFDIHDLLHHPLQLAAWPDQFEEISKAGFIAHALPVENEHAKRLKKLTQLTWLASFEESLITTDGQLVSFGCLNWLSPSETPLDRMPDISQLSVEDQKIAYRWHYLDALKDMFRIGIANSKQFGEELNWVERLGYAVDDRLKAMIESDDPRPFENLAYTDALAFEVRTPASPEELFANAMKLIEEEFARAEG